MEQLKQKELVDRDCLISSPLNNYPQNQQLSVTPESVPLNKKTTSHVKLSSCENNFQELKLSKTLDLDLILKERVSNQSWKDACREIQSHLLSHTEIASAVLDLKLSNILSQSAVEKSWFSTKLNTVPNRNSQKTFSPYFMSSLAGCTDSEDTVNKSKKIRIYPTKEQRQIFKQWFGVQRLVYNKVIEYLNDKQERIHWMVVAKMILESLPDFCVIVPYQIKKMAVKEAFDSFFRNVKKIKFKGGKFNLHFKSKKNLLQSCYIPKSAIKENGIYSRISGKGLKYAEKLPILVMDSRLVWNSGRWYLSVPTQETILRAENQGRIVAIDPGIRTFATFFSENSFGQIGYHDFGRIVRLCHHLDNLISRISKSAGTKKRSMKRAADRLRWKIKDLVSELHHKAARFFVDNFDVIFLPTFETSQMVSKIGRKLRKKSVRSMLTYAFYRFSKFLDHKCFETGKTLIKVCEAYTSKTNSFTQELMPNLGSKEFFTFDDIRINRDINGARNILCFSLADTPHVRNNIANVNEN